MSVPEYPQIRHVMKVQGDKEIHTWDSLKENNWYEVTGTVDSEVSFEELEKRSKELIKKKFE